MQIQELLQSIKNIHFYWATRHEIEILLCHSMQITHTYLYAHPDAQITTAHYNAFCTLLQRREQGEPLAYILGECEFWSLRLLINNSVLVPRAETELLVEIALRLLGKNTPLNILELGTGSGAIALSLAHERTYWHICATDISENALCIARLNAQNLNISNITFLHGNWYTALSSLPYTSCLRTQHPQAHQTHLPPALLSNTTTLPHLPPLKFDAIVSNPPYIATNDPYLQSNVQHFEPTLALFAGKNGLDAYNIIINQSMQHLNSGGWLILEHGFNQGGKIRKLLLCEDFQEIATYKDLSGHERVTVGRTLHSKPPHLK